MDGQGTDITPAGSVSPVLTSVEPEGTPEMVSPIAAPSVAYLRLIAYTETADPMFFKWQRGEATEQDWLDAVQAVRDQYPND